MRPVKDVKILKKKVEEDKEGNKTETVKEVLEDRPGWKTTSQWFHWDLAVWAWFGLGPSNEPDKQDLYVNAFCHRILVSFHVLMC